MATTDIHWAPRRTRLERFLHGAYRRWIRPHIRQELHRQRFKLLVFVWGYWQLLFISSLSPLNRLRLLIRCLTVDWYVLHAHQPCEIVNVFAALADRPANSREILLEAGCWKGGSSAKFSIICKMLGYRLHIYDSFEGVEELSPEMKKRSYDFSREYAATEATLRDTLSHYGEPSVCSIYKGWFADTLAASPVSDPIRAVYIDCDLAKGTYEVLKGSLPALAEDGWVFSQDCHIRPVQELISDPLTWSRLGKAMPTVRRLCGHLASMRFS
jgi:O-methyltransferase